MFDVAILAGGLATRLRPITETIPKAMVSINGRPFIAHQLDYLKSQNISKVVLCLGYLGEQIQKFVGDGSKFDLNVEYSFDGPVLLGTGGALKKALPKLGKHFYILYGDSVLPIDYIPVEQAYLSSGKLALMTVLKNSNQWDKSNVIFKDGELVIYDKKQNNTSMNYIDYGLGIMDAKVLNRISENNFDIADVYNKLSLNNELKGYEVFNRFYEIGSHAGLKETEQFFRERQLK
jgi:NDP-sugar pyrophosphorylase family protein